MRSFFAKTFGGLTTSYYIRQFLFGLLFTVMIISLAANGPGGIGAKPGLIVLAIINTLLYPYSRFVYESVVGYIMGNNVFFRECTVDADSEDFHHGHVLVIRDFGGAGGTGVPVLAQQPFGR